jgi:hypothetical protein
MLLRAVHEVEHPPHPRRRFQLVHGVLGSKGDPFGQSIRQDDSDVTKVLSDEGQGSGDGGETRRLRRRRCLIDRRGNGP